MSPHRIGKVVFVLGPLAVALTACGSEDQSLLLGIGIGSTVVVNEICANEEGVCVLSAACITTSATCVNSEDEECTAQAAACAKLDVDDHATEDWVELYNFADRDVDLEGYYLSDSSKNRRKTKLPKGSIVPAYGYLVLFANALCDGGRNLCFKMSNAEPGESVVLSSPTGEWLDQLWVASGDDRGSWARVPDGTGPQPDTSCFFPSPGWENSAACTTE